MSSTTMSQNQEIIEAKLCAYIDGELDLEGRSEIERHLEANPQHRRLLESLKATKDLVRWLPREQAPPEVAETLNGQLERSVLLDYDGNSLRPHMWPRVLAAAAIVALTVGLAAAVYFALPKSQKPATPYAFHPAEPSTLTPAVAPDSATSDLEKPGEAVAAKPQTPTAALTETQNRIQQTQEPAIAGQSNDLDDLVRQVSQNRSALLAAANSTNQSAANQSAPALAANAMVMLVRSDAPQRTEKQLVSFLDSQKIQWKQAPAEESQTLAIREKTAQTFSEPPQQQYAAGRTLAKSMNQVAGTQPSPDNADASAAIAGVYVARMSHEQAVQLNSTIANDGAQAVALQSPGIAGGLAAQRDPTASVSPTTQPGTQLPSVPQLQVPDVSTRDESAKQSPSFAYSPTTAPSTQPADQLGEQVGRLRRQSERLAVAQQSVPATQPATQPAVTVAAATTQPADAGVDVVILVQPNTVASSAAAPTTQPASQVPAPPATQPVQ